MAQFSRLGRDGLRPGLESIAQVRHTDAAGKVDILPSLRVIKARSLSVVNGHRKPPVGVHDILLGQIFDLLRSHGYSSLFSIVPMPRSESSSMRMEWGMRPSRM